MPIWAIPVLLLATTSAFSTFKNQIPNGRHVLNPCSHGDLSSTWEGVGHLVSVGGGALNPFGNDFRSNGFKWDDELCGKDSDGDGRTNGEELGDPDCTWRAGNHTAMHMRITHPGICEPIDDPNCKKKNSWLLCTSDADIRCDLEPGVTRLDVTIPPAEVPAKKTTYSCTAVQLPVHVRDADLHVVGVQGIRDNIDLVHHIVIYGCEGEMADKALEVYGNTRDYDEMNRYCPNRIFSGVFSQIPECLPTQYGYRIGKNGYTVLLIQIHWNNRELLAGQMDASGVALYYTQDLRPFDGQQIQIGPHNLEIPPGQRHWRQTGVCPSHCTNHMFQSTVYVSKILPHMHLTGSEFRVDVVRSTGAVETLIHVNFTFYHHQFVQFDPPAQIHPGDSVRVTCGFDSSSRRHWTYYGLDTSSEMCFANVQLYPKQALIADCWYMGSDVTQCGMQSGVDHTENCIFLLREYSDELDKDLEAAYEQLSEHCDVSGVSCRPGCKDAIAAVQEHPCLRPELLQWAKTAIIRCRSSHAAEIIQSLASCSGLVFNYDNDPPVQYNSLDIGEQPISPPEWCAPEHHVVPDHVVTDHVLAPLTAGARGMCTSLLFLMLIPVTSCRHVTRIVLYLALTVVLANGFPNFRKKIPNGERVPNPCTHDVGSAWRGVGHLVPGGGGSLNPFGAAFKENQYIWSSELCGQDSDGDGRTNGEELGDPDCMWTPDDDTMVLRTHALSHPGICEPIYSPQCTGANSWLDCEDLGDMDCPVFDDPESQRFEVRMPQIQLAEQETTYMCATVEAPDHIREGDYHVVGLKAIVDNAQVLHHMEIFGCLDEKADAARRLYGTPRECKHSIQLCTNRIYIWTFGLDSECFPPEYGFRIGADGYKTFLLEFHYNNGRRLSEQLDTSGAWMYYTEHLRPHDAMQMFVGAMTLQVPPAQAQWALEGTCPEQCTRRIFTEQTYIAKILPHMHLLGRELRVYLTGSDGVTQLLVDDRDFGFKYHRHYVFDPPVEIQPGDSLTVSCSYDSTQKEDWTYFGYGTSEEMCMAGIQLYPKPETEADCWDFGANVSHCGQLTGRDRIDECRNLFYGRNTREELNADISEVFKQLNQFCDVTGRVCYTGCQSAIDLATEHPCLVATVYPFFSSQLLSDVTAYHAEIMQALASCSGIQYNTYKYDAIENDVIEVDMNHDVTPEKLTTSDASRSSPAHHILTIIMLPLLANPIFA